MSDNHHPRRKRAEPEGEAPAHGPDFAAQMARAEFGRHYVDPGRIEQTLRDGEVVFRHRKPDRARKPR